ncbi:MAG: hypothetical protein FWC56_05795, partial [Phycisphaerae bacterium]|nr:hypothetical protein [Phycisphaerae bacterium]
PSVATTILFSTSTLPAGTYTATITFSNSQGGSVNVPVYLTVEPILADLDGDGDIDQDDFAMLQVCLSNGATDPSNLLPGCESADFNNNGVIDADDIQLFMMCTSGPGMEPTNPNCIE